ncbi:hypothetical protein ADIARSV_3532 [Arcticibacter svalbardensis MN12-7]|uniref:Uncharacterized protein n=1 Tax=Arcticibacter svalbardensis MN12-7 TaxID=1150600 RepID=R9GNK4_9SPHI|nr:hypothetical protein [Arcticibacter svalbardensis]EOR93298.1 hypothetical protein ADIARSV_3532 [Arcticibacter svalbardensis MN12-7]
MNVTLSPFLKPAALSPSINSAASSCPNILGYSKRVVIFQKREDLFRKFLSF